MKINIVYILIAMTFLACTQQQERPKDVLDKEQMIDVIADIELAQALIKLRFANPDTVVNRQELYEQVYENYNITEDQFNASLTHYCRQPNVLEGIYVEVINRLSEEQVKPN